MAYNKVLTPIINGNHCIVPLSIFTNGEGLRNKECTVKEQVEYTNNYLKLQNSSPSLPLRWRGGRGVRDENRS